MSCYSCGSEFGFLKKEIGCELCGFSFCSKCCKKQEILNKSGQIVKQYICKKCYDRQSNSESKDQNQTGSPPLAHKKRMESLKKQSFSVGSGYNVPSSHAFTNEQDKEIALRLQKLKRDRVKDIVPTEENIAERLAKLKGMDPLVYKAPPIEVYRPLKSQSSVDEASNLIKQVTEEVAIDLHRDDEIATRLSSLSEDYPEKSLEKEMDIDKANEQLKKEYKATVSVASGELKDLMNDPKYRELIQGVQNDEIMESDEEEEKLVEKLMATNLSSEELDTLDEDTEDSSLKNEKDTTEELPWCVICPADAVIKCFGCDGDLYCIRCFKECHDSLEITDHKTCAYLSPKKFVA